MAQTTWEQTIGDRVRRARQRQKLGQRELAKQVGLSSATLNYLEMGHTPNPRVNTIIALAEALGVTTDYLLLGREETEERTAVATGAL